MGASVGDSAKCVKLQDAELVFLKVAQAIDPGAWKNDKPGTSRKRIALRQAQRAIQAMSSIGFERCANPFERRSRRRMAAELNAGAEIAAPDTEACDDVDR